MFRNHPAGFWVLFFTVMGERFGHYGLRSNLVLYLCAPLLAAGLGWPEVSAISTYGNYVMAIYLACIPSGLLADRVFGKKQLAIAGGFVLCLGHLTMTIHANWALYLALALIALGVGMQKPNLATMVGELYPNKDPRIDQAYNVLYMGVNIGALVGCTLVPIVSAYSDWHVGFGLACFAAFISQIVLLTGKKHLAEIGNFIPANTQQASEPEKLSREEKDRIAFMLITFFGVGMLFWAIFEQCGGLVNLYTRTYTDRSMLGWEIPTGLFLSLNSFFVIIFMPSVDAFWAKRKKAGKEASNLIKNACAMILIGFGFVGMVAASATVGVNPNSKSSMLWLVATYYFMTIAELSLGPTGMAFVRKLSPKKYTALMMGLFFGSTGLSGYLSGLVGGQIAAQFGVTNVFSGIVVISCLVGLLLICFKDRLNKMAHGAEN